VEADQQQWTEQTLPEVLNEVLRHLLQQSQGWIVWVSVCVWLRDEREFVNAGRFVHDESARLFRSIA
jgi:hypothetical protein